MKFYAIYMKTQSEQPLETIDCVCARFSFMAGVFQGFWALYQRMWVVAALLFALEALMAFAKIQGVMGEVSLAVINLALLAYVGFSASDWREASLKRKGFQLMDVVVARNEMEAQQRYLDQQFARHNHMTAPKSTSLEVVA